MSPSPTPSSVAKPLGAPPAISLHRIRASQQAATLPPAVVTPTEADPSSLENKKSGGKDKVGRWSEEEHQVFLEGLELHGKQWKTIATMIGTRTVVQVRTHAQKYFHKIERSKKKTVPRWIPAKQTSAPPARKRTSDSPVVLATKKSKRIQEKNEASSVQASHVSPEMTSHPSCTAASETWSTDSPAGVEDFGIDFDEAQMALELLGDEPLEWLIEGDSEEFLPESSLPVLSYEDGVSDSAFEDILHPNMVDVNLTMSSLLAPSNDS